MENSNFVWASGVHKPTPEQIAELKEKFGMKELNLLPEEIQARINNCPDNWGELYGIAKEVHTYLKTTKVTHLICLGGSPAFQHIFTSLSLSESEAECVVWGPPFKSMFAHSNRVSVDDPQPDGSVIKKSVFKHSHFIVC